MENRKEACISSENQISFVIFRSMRKIIQRCQWTYLCEKGQFLNKAQNFYLLKIKYIKKKKKRRKDLSQEFEIPQNRARNSCEEFSSHWSSVATQRPSTWSGDIIPTSLSFAPTLHSVTRSEVQPQKCSRNSQVFNVRAVLPELSMNEH